MADDDNPQGGNIDEKVNQAFQKFLEKFQKPEDGALKLYGENYQLRQTNSTLKTENEELKKKVPGDDMHVIGKDDRAILDAAKSLNLKPEEITNLQTENAKLKRSQQFTKLVDAGYSLSALETFDELQGKEIEGYDVKEETKDNKPVKSGIVKVGGKELSLDDYAKEKRPAIASILKSNNQQQLGPPWPKQDAGGGIVSKSEFDEIREEAKGKQAATQPKDSVSVLAALSGQRAAATT